MKLKTLTLSLLLGLAATSAFAEDQYIVRVPANVNLAAPEAPQPPVEPISLALSDLALPAGMVGEPYSFNLLDRLTITGGSGSHNYSDTTWSLKAGDTLPPGLSISGSTISGTPTVKNEAGTAFEVTGTYQDASGKQVYTIVVGGQVLQVTQISAGGNHTCVITKAGAAKCWGDNQFGQLGDGTKINRMSPVIVSGLASEVASLSSGQYHTCAITRSGGAKCWGHNYYGQLGDGTTTDRTSPVDVTGMKSGVAIISSGSSHTCAVTNEGAAKCWGGNEYGQIGFGTKINVSSPVVPTGLSSGVKDIAVAYDNTCAVTTLGQVKCWGRHSEGQIGDGTMTERTTPAFVTNLSSGYERVVLGFRHACAISSDGTVKCWGDNRFGQLGDGTTIMRSTPVNISGLSSGLKNIEVSTFSTCVITAEGGLKWWGYNANGELGDGTITNRFTPDHVSGLVSGVAQITGGVYHFCAMLSSGSAKCWGQNHYGKLGDGTTTNRSKPVDVLP